jgi:hypothetical protein
VRSETIDVRYTNMPDDDMRPKRGVNTEHKLDGRDRFPQLVAL